MYIYICYIYIHVQMVCQELCQNSVSGWGSLEESIVFLTLSQVITVPVICDGFIQLTSETLEAIPEVWTAQHRGGHCKPYLEWQKRGLFIIKM